MISSSGWQRAFRLLRFSRLSNRRWSRSPDCGPIDDRDPRGPEGLASYLQGRTTTRAKTCRMSGETARLFRNLLLYEGQLCLSFDRDFISGREI